MVALVKKTKIFKGETPLEELGQAFRDEVEGMLKDAALKLNCAVEELKYRFDNLGRVEVVRMTLMEMKQAEEERQLELRKKKIRRVKGMDN